MRPLIFFAFLLLLSSQIPVEVEGQDDVGLLSASGDTQAVIYYSGTEVDTSQALGYLLEGVPVVFYGNTSIHVSELYPIGLGVENRTRVDSNLVASGLWLQENGGEYVEHQLAVYDYGFTNRDMDSIYEWLDQLTALIPPSEYRLSGIITEIDHHEPYGELVTRTEVLRVVDENTLYDWYDVSVTQRLTPGINYTSSSWEWNWLTYTMNGSLGASNVYLSDYDSPPSEELPKGPFSFLWRILGFDIRDLIPWLGPEPNVEGVDMSDFSLELYRVRYQAPQRYRYRDEPLETRYHYVLRVGEGSMPVFWQQTQVQYTQREDFAQIPYVTHPLASGYIAKLK